KFVSINFGSQQHVNFGLLPFSGAENPNFFAGSNGINVPNGASILRGTATIYGQDNVAVHAGSPASSGTAGVQLGALAGAVPFVGASRTSGGAATSLRCRTDATFRLERLSGGSYLRPAADNALNLGGASNRFATIYAGTG